jgi:hypothetical protein
METRHTIISFGYLIQSTSFKTIMLVQKFEYFVSIIIDFNFHPFFSHCPNKPGRFITGTFGFRKLAREQTGRQAETRRHLESRNFLIEHDDLLRARQV